MLLLALILPAPMASAQPQRQPAPAGDVAGGRDHPLVGRYQGATLRFYRQRDYEELRLVNRPSLSRDVREQGAQRHERNSIAVAGRATRLRYEGPEGRSALEVLRNHQERLRANGFEIAFECRGADCGTPPDHWSAVVNAVPQPPAHGMTPGWATQSYSFARLARPEGDVFVSILAVDYQSRSNILVDVVEARPMEAGRIVFIDASAMQQSVERTGRVALYGVLFATDSADIQPASRPTLEEIARFLRANATMNVVITGHTDSQGSFEHNLGLSMRRAQSVIASLTREFQIAPARLTPFGAGMASPVASNDNDAGRQQNRRVEIVKR
ncbi:DUF4892 domain-containing protein [Sediminicoccus sp. KRV36]|uniref:DUF4892 domain-containing protein n=1 Tax=Sediminicoccus sp. KRV36 TaxID=3133721 RepID=UPI00200D19F0|nr:DUF4892 domain-containing protein [Sediminicoccus rosea]UPY38209.1 DUF4892 domain-containing protein [Sediminicoccus rosea]